MKNQNGSLKPGGSCRPPVSFDISVWQFLSNLLAGGAVQVVKDEITHDPSALLNLLERDGITIFETVPSMLRAMLDEAKVRGESRPSLARRPASC